MNEHFIFSLPGLAILPTTKTPNLTILLSIAQHKMDTKFESLPPLKRFRLLQKQQQIDQNKENEIIPHNLPAKKRKETRHFHQPTVTSSYTLPAKKRVWAFHPDFISTTPLSSIDLNVEYNPFHQNFPEKPTNDAVPLKVSTDVFSIETRNDENEDKETLVPDEKGQIVETSNDESEEDRDERAEIEEDDDGILCAVCHSTDGDPADPIVFCDGCNLMVHTTCYGNPLVQGVPEGDWFCAQCLASKSGSSSAISCSLCSSQDGAMKPTKGGLWAHLVCAVFIPEVFFEDPDGREGVDCSKVPKRRWEDKCYVCKKRTGCVLQCSETKCHLSFHITCGLKEDLCIEYQQGKRNTNAIVAGFCTTHTKLWKKQQQTGKFKIVAEEELK